MVRYHIININLKQKPEWYFTKNPLGSTPCLESDEKIVTDSAIICDYLDDAYSSNPLWPEDPYQKARDKMVLDYHSSKVCTRRNVVGSSFHSFIVRLLCLAQFHRAA